MREINRFQKLKERSRLIKSDVRFLQRCLRNNLCPKFVTRDIRVGMNSKNAHKAVYEARRRYMKLEIKTHYARLEKIGRELYPLQLFLMKSLSMHEWKRLDERIWWATRRKIQVKEATLRKKFRSLRGFTMPQKRTDDERDERIKFITNKSSVTLSREEDQLIAKGLKYKPVPEEPPVNEIIVSIETAIKPLTNDVKAIIREEVSKVLAEENYLNTHSTGEWKLLNNLRKSGLCFLAPDKGKGTVVLDKSEYYAAAIQHIKEGAYESVETTAGFPVDSLQRKLNSGLRQIIRKGVLDEKEKFKFIVSNPSMPTFSIFPKTHKPGNKVRPVISNCNSPSSKISEWLVKKFRRFKSPAMMSVKNSFDLCEKLKDIDLAENEVLVSFDVEALFPSIPIKKAFERFVGWLEEQDISDDEAVLYADLTELVLGQRWFEFDGKIYQQKKGLFIGNPLSSIITEVFLGDLEESMREKPWFPRVWHRYVDDVLAVVEAESVDTVLQELNLANEAIKFTCEIETGGKLPFLDVLVIRNEKKLEFDVYRKPTDAPICIPKDSHHHYAHQRAAFESYVFRAYNLPLTQERREREISHIKSIAKINGYAYDFIDDIIRKHELRRNLREITTLDIIKPERKRSTQDRFGNMVSRFAILPYYSRFTFKIEKILRRQNINVCYSNRGTVKEILNNVKKKRDDKEKSGIYAIACEGSRDEKCESIYVGQTKRRLEQRQKEHERAVSNRQIEKSSVARHCMNEGHKVGKTTLLKQVDKPMMLDGYESMYMANTDELMNEGEPPITSKLFKFASMTSLKEI